MLGKKSAFFTLLVVTLVVLGAGNASAQFATGSIKDVIETVGSYGNVDWTTGVITAVGVGAPPAQSANAGQARAMAERTAQMAAHRNLLEALKDVRVDSTTKVDTVMATSDAIKTDVSGIIQGAMVMDKKYMSDGSVEVTVGIKMSGALAQALLPKGPARPQAPPAGAAMSADPGRLYTGLVVDARGLGIIPAMAPKILDKEGKEVYGSARVSRDYAVREGMIGYSKDPAAAQTNPRVADKPLMVKGVKAAGDARVDVVISDADAAAVQSAAQNLITLEKCRVIILVD